ncbi:MAG TPA: class I SAM-dependent methyltransferase [Candidatus Latescibacteria bacterium]|nr:class I SAM-dependent methyltransferase [Candidatus Latescibacterota bacterium]HJP32634.1 class I SAM-dependent methyltransferase [Candidatus Latescibacterota bacterium]
MGGETTGVRGHTSAWYERLATLQEGYYYPWESTTADGGGEAAYSTLVRQHLTPELDVLEAGCGHGVDAVSFAPLCRSLRAYDQVDRYVTLARQAVAEHGIDNTTLLCRNSSADRNGGQVTVPALTASIDVVISRRGPTNWIEDAPRFCRPGAVLLQLNPLGLLEEYSWNRQLPESLRLSPPDPDPDAGMRSRIETRLARVGLAIHSCWTYDVPEWLHGPRELYRFLTFGRSPDEVESWPEVHGELSAVFARHAVESGLELRNRRFLWKSVLGR